MKTILIVISEYGALAYILPVIEKLLKNYKIVLFSDLVKENIFKKYLTAFNLYKNFKIESSLNSIKKTIKKFDCVISSATSKRLENELILESKIVNTKNIQFIDNSYGWKKRLTYNGKTVFPDYLCLVNRKCIKYAAQEGIPLSILKPIGNPAWDSIKSKFERKNRKTLFIGTPIFEIYKNQLGYTEKDVWKMCLKASNEHPKLLIGLKYLLHPKQKIPPYINKKYIIRKRDRINHYGQIIGIFSSFLTEAWYMKKKVISIQPNNFRDDKWIISKYFEKTYAKNYREFINMLKKEIPKNNYAIEKLNSTKNLINLIKKATK